MGARAGGQYEKRNEQQYRGDAFGDRACRMRRGGKDDHGEIPERENGCFPQEVADAGAPPQGFADLVVKAEIKTHREGYYIAESKESPHGKPGYPFVLNVDGQAAVWKVDGQKDVKPASDEKGKTSKDPEAGTGIKYVLEKSSGSGPVLTGYSSAFRETNTLPGLLSMQKRVRSIRWNSSLCTDTRRGRPVYRHLSKASAGMQYFLTEIRKCGDSITLIRQSSFDLVHQFVYCKQQRGAIYFMP